MWLYCAAECIIYGYERDNYLQFLCAVGNQWPSRCADYLIVRVIAKFTPSGPVAYCCGRGDFGGNLIIYKSVGKSVSESDHTEYKSGYKGGSGSDSGRSYYQHPTMFKTINRKTI